MENHDAVWAETTDGGLLRQLFGYYPTLHDSRIVSVTLDRRQDRLTIVFDYRDHIENEPTQELAVRVQMEWMGIQSVELPLGETDLLSLHFEPQGDFLRTTLETWPGVFGTIVSERVEVVLLQADAIPQEDVPFLRYG